MVTVDLPDFVAGADFADRVVDALGPLGEDTVRVDAENLVSWTEPFASRLVERILTDSSRTATLTVKGAPYEFAESLLGAAKTFDVTERLTLVATQHAPA